MCISGSTGNWRLPSCSIYGSLCEPGFVSHPGVGSTGSVEAQGDGTGMVLPFDPLNLTLVWFGMTPSGVCRPALGLALL